MIKLNLGSGILLLGDYINVDSMFTLDEIKDGIGKKGNMYQAATIEKGAKFVKADVLHLPFKKNYADLIEAHQLIEHFRIKDVIPALKEMYRVLKPGGKLILTTPDFTGLCVEWLKMVSRPSEGFDPNQWAYHAEEFYGYQVNEGETHRCPMTPQWLMFCLGQAGFHGSTGFMQIFPINSPIPTEGYGLVSRIMRGESKDNNQRLFRTETIYMEVIK